MTGGSAALLDLTRGFLTQITQLTLGGWIMIITFLLFVMGLFFLTPVFRTRQAFIVATRRIRSAKKTTPSLAETRVRLRSGLFANPRLSTVWSTFCRSWEEARLPEPYEGAPVSPNDYFIPADLLTHTRTRLLVSGPGILLSLGILGTFLGLVVGLGGIELRSVAPGAATVDPAVLLDSVYTLVGGLSIAFYTSVVGITLSLIFLVAERLTVSSVIRRTTEFCHEVGTVYPQIDPGQWAAILVRTQNEQLQTSKTLAVDIATAVGSQIGESLTNHLGPMLENLANAVVSATESSAGSQMEAMRDMVDRFIEQLNTSVGDQFNTLGTTVDGLTERLSQLVDRMDHATAGQATLIEQTNKASEVIGHHLPALLEFGTGMQSISEILAQSISEIERLRTNLRDQVATSTQAQAQAAQAISAASSQISESAGRLEGASRQLAGMSATLETVFTDGLSRFEENVRNGLRDVLLAFDSTLSDILSRFSGTLADARDSIEGLREHGENLSAKMTPAAEKLGEHVAGLASATGTYLEAWQGVVSSLGTIREQLSATADTVSSALSMHKDALESATVNMVSGLETTLARIDHLRHSRLPTPDGDLHAMETPPQESMNGDAALAYLNRIATSLETSRSDGNGEQVREILVALTECSDRMAVSSTQLHKIANDIATIVGSPARRSSLNREYEASAQSGTRSPRSDQSHQPAQTLPGGAGTTSSISPTTAPHNVNLPRPTGTETTAPSAPANAVLPKKRGFFQSMLRR